MSGGGGGSSAKAAVALAAKIALMSKDFISIGIPS
jgi:hypothetical protein